MGSSEVTGSGRDVPAATESALIVPIPEAERVVGGWRASLDGSAAWGVPAHVTVLYLFVPPLRIGAAEVERMALAVGSVPGFDVAFDRVEWFGEDAVWLAPEPADGFRELTLAAWSAFPEFPPYAGAFDTVVPHLTIGAGCDIDRMRGAARAVAGHLPVHASVRSAFLFQGSDGPGTWHSVAELPLGTGGAGSGGAQRFTATVVTGARGRVFVPLGFDPAVAWGEKPAHHVAGTVGRCRMRGVVEPLGDGHGLVLGPAWRRDSGVGPGDTVAVTLAPEGPQRGDLAPDFAAALAANPAARAFFDSLAQFYRRAYLRWIDATKRRPEDRTARIAEVVRLLEAGVKQRG